MKNSLVKKNEKNKYLPPAMEQEAIEPRRASGGMMSNDTQGFSKVANKNANKSPEKDTEHLVKNPVEPVERRHISREATSGKEKFSVVTLAGSSSSNRAPNDIEANTINAKRRSYTSSSTEKSQQVPNWKERSNTAAALQSSNKESARPGAFPVDGFSSREEPSTDLPAPDIENGPGIQLRDSQQEQSSVDLPIIEATKVEESSSFQFEQAAVARKELPVAEAKATWSRCTTITAVAGLVVITGTIIGVVVATMSGSSSTEPATFSPTTYEPASFVPTASPSFQAFTSKDDLTDAIGNYASGKDYALLSELLSIYGYDIGEWNVSLITDFSEVFSYTNIPALALFNEDITQWDTSQAISMNSCFEGAAAFNQPIGNWSVGNVRDFSEMFKNAAIFDAYIGDWDVSFATTIRSMFQGAVGYNQPLEDWNVSAVTDMGSVFQYAVNFNQNIGKWDTSSVTDLSSAFELVHVDPTGFGLVLDHFNQPIGKWRTDQVKSMASMLSNQNSFNQPLEWNVSSVEDMSGLFQLAMEFNSPTIGEWDVSSVKKMGRIDHLGPSFTSHGMFEAAHAFNQDLSKWDTSHVEDMTGMFRDAVNFNHPLDAWDVSSVKKMSHSNDWESPKYYYIKEYGWESAGMFSGATSFNQPLPSWNLSSLEDMGELFRDASSFRQNLCSWGSFLKDKNIPVKNAFAGTACPNTSDPILDANPPGPFCFNCG